HEPRRADLARAALAHDEVDGERDHAGFGDRRERARAELARFGLGRVAGEHHEAASSSRDGGARWITSHPRRRRAAISCTSAGPGRGETTITVSRRPTRRVVSRRTGARSFVGWFGI